MNFLVRLINPIPRLYFWLSGLLLLSVLLSASAAAETLYLAKGGARTLKMNTVIDTVFTTDPEIVDYNLISDREVVIYGIQNGIGEILLVQNDVTRKIQVVVDPLVGKLAAQIQDQFPGSTIELKKVGDSYILAGIAVDEESRDSIYQIVGEALGMEADTEVVRISTENMGDIKIPSLTQISYKKLQNRMRLPQANQVNVKISIVELNKSYSDTLGIEWGQSLDVGNFVLNKLRFNASELTSMIHALGNESVARVLAEPNLSVLSGETADFLVGGEIPIMTSSSNGTSVEYKEIGVRMTIGAKVENSQKVKLMIYQEVSNVDDQSTSTDSTYYLPALKSRKARTTVELADGESFVLAGLLSESEQEILKKVPFIGDIPVLGAFFRSTAARREKTELVVVATTNLVRPVSSSQVTLPAWQRSSLLERYFNISNVTGSSAEKGVISFIEQGGFIY